MTWHTALTDYQSKGATAARPGSLAGLAAARREHEGQFFTPPALVDFCWRLVRPAIDRRTAQGKRTALLDNSCGIGRFFWPADPAHHTLIGQDVDGEALAALEAAARAAGFDTNLVHAGLEQTAGARAHVGFLNPPFSITLSSPVLTPYDGVTHWGAHGPHTHAISQGYAIAQAVEGCEVVVAVVPSAYVPQLHAAPALSDRLRAVIELPPGLFRSEGTDVRVSVAVWAEPVPGREVQVLRVERLDDPAPDLGLQLHMSGGRVSAPKVRGIDPSEPAIRGDVTGERTVRMSHDGRRLVLGFRCALVEAKVRNAMLRGPILRERDERNRLPKGVKFRGQGLFDLENWLLDDPVPVLDRVRDIIRGAGGEPEVTPTLQGYLRRRARRMRVLRTPLRRWAHVAGTATLETLQPGQTVSATAAALVPTDPSRIGAPVLRRGAAVQLAKLETAEGVRYQVQADGAALMQVSLEQAQKAFTITDAGEPAWALIAPGRRVAFPELAATRRRKAHAVGATTFAHWAPDSGEDCYQLDDLIELSMSPRGLAAWDMALGKTRLALGLALMGGDANLIVLQSHLVPEMLDEIRAIGLPESLWQVIESPAQLDDLRRVNIISYARLKREIHKGAGRRTYARLLRRRLHTVVADEAHILSHRDTDQSRALWMLSPKARYGLSGTPVASYCRDALPLLLWAGGDGVASQPYGEHQPFISPVNLASMEAARRGIDEFRDRFVTLEWAVREFDDNLRTGAKREIPRLRNVEDFRRMLAPHMLRRVKAEPEVRKWIPEIKVTSEDRPVPWEPGHFEAFTACAEEFAGWYRERKRHEAETGKPINLLALLARVGAVLTATNNPAQIEGPGAGLAAHASKDPAAVEQLLTWCGQGRKSILFAHSPTTLERIAAQLRRHGIDPVIYHGDIGISARTRQLNQRFRHGEAQVLLVSLGAGQTGLNLPMASRVLFYGRGWTPKDEDQALARVMRRAQRDAVHAVFLRLPGSLDAYQAQLVAHKRSASSAGIDYAEQEMGEADFLHLDTVIGQFVRDLEEGRISQEAAFAAPRKAA